MTLPPLDPHTDREMFEMKMKPFSLPKPECCNGACKGCGFQALFPAAAMQVTDTLPWGARGGEVNLDVYGLTKAELEAIDKIKTDFPLPGSVEETPKN